jgi:hypothetical protein
MWTGEPRPFPERGPPTRVSNVGAIKLKKLSGKIRRPSLKMFVILDGF